MNTMTPEQIRRAYIEFFKSKGHAHVPSDAIVPSKDPTLLFTTAGMVQFKALYAGAPLPYSTAVTVQKCIRAGGKGSDLENVGKTLRHHTFFEMLGNFSFGDYFKKEAIAYAYEFIRDVLKMDMEKLWVSVYDDDEEAKQIWIDIGFPAARIVKLGKKDNFWGPAGDEGACGPCSEIYFDLGEPYGCKREQCAVGCDCERFLEFWNLVFPQYYAEKSGEFRPLERRGVDTGMGLERLSFLMDGTAKNNYQTGLFRPIISAIEKVSGKRYEAASQSWFHVIADHSRALVFTIGEGILPSNEGRGYVIRRIIRRAIRFGQKLSIEKPFLAELVPVVIEVMKNAYPEIESSLELVKKIVHEEEQRFQKTLKNAVSILDQEIDTLKAKNLKVFPGEVSFRLYDTYGLPLDIIRELVLENDLQFDQEGFDVCLKNQKTMGKQSWKGTSYTVDVLEKQLSGLNETEFCGYDKHKESSGILALFKDGQRIENAHEGETVCVVCSKTPFYAESGGQVSDTGSIRFGEKGLASVIDVQKLANNIYVHEIHINQGILATGDVVHLEIDSLRRQEIRKHHTATHMLQAVLISVLGSHVKQAGSLVSYDRLRFDFSHTSRLTVEEIQSVESKMNDWIIRNENLSVEHMSLAEAKEKKITANFGDKYGDKVRAVFIGDDSRELCGGTHLTSTGLAGGFKILSENSVSSGVRRIEAVVGKAFIELCHHKSQLLASVVASLKTSEGSVLERTVQITENVKALEKKIIEIGKARPGEAKWNYNFEHNGVDAVIEGYENLSADVLQSRVDEYKSKSNRPFVFLVSIEDNKLNLISYSPVPSVHAGNWVRDVAAVCDGKGGGRPDLGRGGGKDVSRVEAVLQKARETLQGLLAK